MFCLFGKLSQQLDLRISLPLINISQTGIFKWFTKFWELLLVLSCFNSCVCVCVCLESKILSSSRAWAHTNPQAKILLGNLLRSLNLKRIIALRIMQAKVKTQEWNDNFCKHVSH